MASALPSDLEREILLRLPAKSLKRFTTVCKSWYTQISDPNFICTFHHRSSLKPHLLLLKHPIDPLSGATVPHFTLSSESFDEGPSTAFRHNHGPHDDDHDHGLLPWHVELVNSNCVNGILCVVVHLGLPNGPATKCDFYLWDLSTEVTVKVPTSGVTGLFAGDNLVKFYAGFGYDEIRDDYKVVRIVYMDSVHATVEVFSLKEFCWKKVNPQPDFLSNMFWAGSMCTFANRAGHWGAFGMEMKDRFFILAFLFGRERFMKVRLPEECVDGREMRYHSLWVYKGLLALSVLHFAGFDSNSTRQYIWARMVVEGDVKPQWVRLFNIDLVGAPRRPVAALMNGNVLLLGEGNGDCVLYNPEFQEAKSLDIVDVDSVVPFAESLISLNKLLPSSSSLPRSSSI